MNLLILNRRARARARACVCVCVCVCVCTYILSIKNVNLLIAYCVYYKTCMVRIITEPKLALVSAFFYIHIVYYILFKTKINISKLKLKILNYNTLIYMNP